MAELFQFTTEEQIQCVRRELAMRQRVYPKWVEGKRMKQETADRELALMQSIHDRLTAVKELEGRRQAAMQKYHAESMGASKDDGQQS